MNPLPSAKHRLLFSTVTIGVIATILAAASEAVYTPTVKLVSADTGVLMSLAFVLLGAGCGSLIILGFGRKSKAVFDPERHVRKKDVVKLICLIGLTPLSFGLNLVGIQQESAATASLLQNAVIVSTVLFAALFLKEKISKRLGIGVTLIVLGSAALAVTNITTLSFSTGAVFLVAGCLTMGVLFIVSKLLAERNPIEVIIIRGFGTGILVFILAFCMGESLPSPSHALGLMAIGFIACGLSPLLMMYGQRYLGAAKAGAVYGIYPLLGALFAIPILGEMPSPSLLAALILFIPGMYFVITKHTGNTAAAAEQRDERMREDAEYLQPISKEKIAGMRNYLTSFGFLIVAMFFVLMVLDLFGSAADTAETAAADVFSSGFFIPGIVLGILLLFIGIGAMMDFTPLLRKPGLFLCGLFSQVGIFLAAMIACLAGFSRAESLAIGIIGAADGPTAIFVAKHLNSSFSGQIALASYSYIALVPLILPVVARFLVTRKERLIRAESDWGQKELPRIVRIAFPIAVTLLSGFIAPRSAELVGFLMFGNLVRECGVLDTMAETARTTLCNLITLLLGISISFTMQAESFVQPETLLILAIGLAAFILDNICGVLFVKAWNLFRKNRINPLAGLAGISAFPIAAHVTQNIAHDADSSNIILMDTAAANVSGQLCSAIIGGIFMGFVC